MRFRLALIIVAVFSIVLVGCGKPMENKELKGDRSDTQGSMKNNTQKDPTVDENK